MTKFTKLSLHTFFNKYIAFHNYSIFIFLKFLVNIFKFKSVFIFNSLTRIFHIGNFCFSYYGVKLFNPNFKDPTFRYCNGGAYGTYYYEFLKKIRHKFDYLDVGANIGIYTLIANKNKNLENAFSFEPNIFIFNNLLKNTSDYKNIHTFNYAISNIDGDIDFLIDPSSSGSSKITSKNNNSKVKVKNYRFLKKNIILKNLLEVKIDVEGHEEIVLDEILNTFNMDAINSIYIEIENKSEVLEKFKKKLISFSLIYLSENSKRCDCHFLKKQV